MDARQARALVEARLGGPPQDALEAAVVLEAWGGLRPAAALDLGRRAIVVDNPRHHGRRGAVELPTARLPGHAAATLLALAVTVMWMAPLGDALGEVTIRRAWQLALPIALVLQAVMRRRYLFDRDRLDRLRASMFEGFAMILIPAASLLVIGAAGIVAAGLVVVWVSVPIAICRGWAWCYIAAAGVGWATVALGVPVVATAVGVTVLVVATAVVAVSTSPASPRSPIPWVSTIGAAISAAGLGGLIVLEAGIAAGLSGSITIFALLPSLVGGAWAVQYLDRLWDVLPAALRKTPARVGDRSHLRRAIAMVMAGAFARLFVATTALSAGVFVLASEAHQPNAEVRRLLFALGIIGVISVLAAALETCGPSAGGVLTTAVAFATTAAVELSPAHDRVPGGPIVVGLVAALAWAGPPLLALCLRPDTSFATEIE